MKKKQHRIESGLKRKYIYGKVTFYQLFNSEGKKGNILKTIEIIWEFF